MEKEIKIKSICSYNGHVVNPNKAVTISFKFRYDELVNYLQSVQMLNENINIIIKLGDKKPMKIGMFMIKGLVIDGDGEAVIKFNSQLDFVESTSINEVAAFGKDEQFKIMLEAKIEIEEDEKTSDDESWDE